MSERFKVCERCGSEFVPAVESCIDCGGPLAEIDLRLTAPPGDRRRPPPPPGPTPPPISEGDERIRLRYEEPSFVQPLAQRLTAAGIPNELVPDADCKSGCAIRYGLWVRAGDLDAAIAVDREYFADVVPQAAACVDLDLDGDGCPACGTPRSPGEIDCPGCGLGLDFAPEEAELAR